MLGARRGRGDRARRAPRCAVEVIAAGVLRAVVVQLVMLSAFGAVAEVAVLGVLGAAAAEVAVLGAPGRQSR